MKESDKTHETMLELKDALDNWNEPISLHLCEMPKESEN